MHTGHQGVIEINTKEEGKIPATDIERTLIDLSVRPVYSGGVVEVLKAYQLAKERIEIDVFANLYKALGYKYPYHQVIGFYLERSGYDDASVRLFKEFERKFDFYLVHGMREMSYSETWRLYYPKGLD